MDALNPPFLAATVDPATLRSDVRGRGGDPLVADLTGQVVGLPVPCRFTATAPLADNGELPDRARYAVSLELHLAALATLELELAQPRTDDPEAELEAALARTADPALSRLRIDDAVRDAWFALNDAGRNEPAPCTLRIERGRCELSTVVMPWDRRRMKQVVAVMAALSTAERRLAAAIDEALATDGDPGAPYR